MKKILFATAVALMTVFGSTANAELALMASNGGSFTFDPTNSMGGSSFLVNGDEALDDLAIFVGYRTPGDRFGETSTQFAPLTTGTAVPGANSSLGSYVFDTVSVGGGVTVDATANFRIVDASSATNTNVTHHVLYDLELETSGVSVANQGSLLSVVGFDFNGDADDDDIQGNQIISGFGFSEVAIGDDDGNRALVGDFTFDQGQAGIANSASNNSTTFPDVFNGQIGADLDARSNTGAEAFTLGNLGFSTVSLYEQRAANSTETNSGVFGFQTAGSATIPEPSTLMMASMGLGMVAFRRRKRA